MIEKRHIEAILKVNGLPPTAPEEEIRSVLISSRYNDDEIDTAIMVLKENTETNTSHVDGLHKVFRTDKALRPDEISKLLGIDVAVHPQQTESTLRRKPMSVYQQIGVWLMSFVVALAAIMAYMYITDTGLFHHTSAYKMPM